MRPRIAVLDYGAGNLHSAGKALERAGARALVTSSAAEAATSDALVVPGVGRFAQCVRQFEAAGFAHLARDWVAGGRPLLGVCVGMQILFERSEEDPEVTGFGVLPGRVLRLPRSVTVPHMGWNTVRARRPDALLEGVDGEPCYFVHSYYAEASDAAHVVATTDYGVTLPSVVRVGSAVGTQFHPEKSSRVGLRLLANFVREVAGVPAAVPSGAPAGGRQGGPGGSPGAEPRRAR